MTDIAFEHSVLGESVIAFDGRVLEHFTWQHGSQGRLIVGLLTIEVDGPDRKGRYTVKCTTRPNGRGGGFHLVVDEANWLRIEPLVREAQAATAGG